MTTPLHLKRHLLIVSSWAPPMVGGPQNLYNLFSNINPTDYTILTSARDVSTGLAKGGTWLDGDYVFFDAPNISKHELHPAITSTPDIVRSTSDWIGLIKKIPGTGLAYYTWSTLSRTLKMVSQGVKSVRRQNIGMVMGISDTGPAFFATFLIAKITRRPYVYYLYDIYKGNNLQSVERWLAAAFEKFLMRSAKVVICTNEGTVDFYQRRYPNLPTAIIYNSVFPENYLKQRTPYQPTAPYKIIFTGHVYWAQEQSVLNLIHAMHELKDLSVTLELYIPNPPATVISSIANSSNIHVSVAPQSEMPKIQSSATLLFLPLAWDTKAPDIIATATPGKFTDYLASGRPMLVHAPDYAYVSKYTKEHNLGLVVDINSVDALATAIRNFLARPEQGNAYVDNALRVFAANHEATKNAAKLTELLNLLD